jgi:hypothetical protein
MLAQLEAENVGVAGAGNAHLAPSTTSTAADQVRLGVAAMQVPALAAFA